MLGRAPPQGDCRHYAHLPGELGQPEQHACLFGRGVQARERREGLVAREEDERLV